MLLACLEVSLQESSGLSRLPTMLSALVHVAQSRVKWSSVCSMDVANKWQGEPQRVEGGCGQNDWRWLLLSCLLVFIWLLCSSLRRANSTGDQRFSLRQDQSSLISRVPVRCLDSLAQGQSQDFPSAGALKAVCVRMCVCLWLLSCLILAGGLHPSFCLGVSHLPGCLFLWNLEEQLSFGNASSLSHLVGRDHWVQKLFGMKTHRLWLHKQTRNNPSNHSSVSQLQAYLPTGARAHFTKLWFFSPHLTECLNTCS